jgi:hypothetical protein
MIFSLRGGRILRIQAKIVLAKKALESKKLLT